MDHLGIITRGTGECSLSWLERFVPDRRVTSFGDIDPSQLKSQGFKGVIADLDNTLVAAETGLATPELERWLEALKKDGLQVMIVSNNCQRRVAQVADALNIPYISRARKPAGRAFHQALDCLQLTPAETVMVGDQLLTDIFGGKRIGLYTILVQPISPVEKWTTRLNRVLEKGLIRLLKRQGLL